MPTPPRPSPQADGTPESLHKTQKPANDRAEDRPARQRPHEAGDDHLGAEEDEVSDTSPPAGEAYEDEPKQG